MSWYSDYETGAGYARARTDRALTLKREEEDRVYQAEIRKNQLQKLKEAQALTDELLAQHEAEKRRARELEIGVDPLPTGVTEGPPGRTYPAGTAQLTVDGKQVELPYTSEDYKFVSDMYTDITGKELPTEKTAGLAEVYTTPGAYGKLETDYTAAVTERDTTYEEALAALKAKQAEVEELGGLEELEKKIAELEGEAKKLAEGPTVTGADTKLGAHEQLLTEAGIDASLGTNFNRNGATPSAIKVWEAKTGKKFADAVKERMASGGTITDDAQTAHDEAVTENTDFLTEYKTLLDAASGKEKDILEKYQADLKKLKEEKDKATDKLDLDEIARLEGEINNSKVHRQLNRNQFGNDIQRILQQRDELVKDFETYSSGVAPNLEKAKIAQQAIAVLDAQLWKEMIEQGITDVVLGKSPEIIETVMTEFWGANIRIQKRDDKGDKGKPRWHIYADGKLVESPTNEMYWSQAQLEVETRKEVDDAYAQVVLAAEAALNEKLLEGIITPADLLTAKIELLKAMIPANSTQMIEQMKILADTKFSSADPEGNMIIKIGGNFFRYLAKPREDDDGNKPEQIQALDLGENEVGNILQMITNGRSFEDINAAILKGAGLQ